VWLYQRRHGDVAHGYVRGVGQGVWIAAATALAGDLGEGAPNRILGRISAILWLLVGVVLVAMLTASVTSRLTVDSIDSNIQGLGDLVDRRVATVADTTASRYLDAIDQRYRAVTSIDEAYELLHRHDVDAIVFDAPVLAHHALTKGRGREQVVGTVFNREFYGIAMPTGSARREAVNRSLLEIKADGTYQRLAEQWFGRDGG
jgi:polar amino acid transport system substrate-binding protein